MGESFLSDIPGTHAQTAQLDTVLAADATEEQVVFHAPYRCVITACHIVPDAAVTGDNTNKKNLNLRLADNTEIGNLDLDTGTDLTAFTQSAIALTGTAAQLQLAADAALTLQVEQVGTGVLIPQSRIRVEYRPDEAGA